MTKIKLEALHAMVDWLPRDHMKWTTDRRREFLETFALILDFVYPPCDGERCD